MPKCEVIMKVTIEINRIEVIYRDKVKELVTSKNFDTLESAKEFIHTIRFSSDLYLKGVRGYSNTSTHNLHGVVL